MARGFLVFVGPATVVRHRAATEEARAGFKIRIVDEHDGDLAVHVDALVIVPLAFGRGDAVAEEHERGILDLHAIDVRCRRTHGYVFALRERALLAGGGDAEIDRAVDVELGERNVLRPGAGAVLQVAAQAEGPRPSSVR